MDLKALYLRKKFWINDFFHGGKMWSAFKEINYINNNIVEGEKIRQSHLQDILNFAKENVPFYKNIKGNSLADFPVINKQMILADRDAFLTPGRINSWTERKVAYSDYIWFFGNSICLTSRY